MLMSFSWGMLWPILQPFIGIATLGLGGVIARSLHSAKDHARASEIGTIAHDIAVVVVAETGGAPWAVALQKVIDQLKEAAPTSNQTVIERAAKSALVEAGGKLGKQATG